MSLQVRTTPEANAQIGAIDEWWRRNRLAAPDLFLDELAASFERSATHLTSGARIGSHRCRGHVEYG